jgi:hypothetical protein
MDDAWTCVRKGKLNNQLKEIEAMFGKVEGEIELLVEIVSQVQQKENEKVSRHVSV